MFVGAFVTGLEYSAGCTAEVVGKPEASFFLGALRDLQCTPDEAVMIGDVSMLRLGRGGVSWLNEGNFVEVDVVGCN